MGNRTNQAKVKCWIKYWSYNVGHSSERAFAPCEAGWSILFVTHCICRASANTNSGSS